MELGLKKDYIDREAFQEKLEAFMRAAFALEDEWESAHMLNPEAATSLEEGCPEYLKNLGDVAHEIEAWAKVLKQSD